jgi:sulfatase maturation enzyme AslB (radical SAM superfamily)
MALHACPDSTVVVVPRELIHPIMWDKQAYLRLHTMTTPYEFAENAYGLMLLGKRVIIPHHSWSRQQLIDDCTVIGQAFRRALGERPSYWMTSDANDYTPKSGTAEWSLTYQCDLKCTNCARLGYLPSKVAPMTLDDAREFVRQCREIGWQPRAILITGGEPTLHPDIMDFCRIAQELCPGNVNIWSNGCSDNTRRVLRTISKNKLANVIIGTQKRKGSIEQPIKDVCISPADFGKTRHPCKWHTSRAIHCGVSVDHEGYIVCPNGGVYNSVLKLGVATKRLADLFDPDFASKQTQALCRHCGMLYFGDVNNLTTEQRSACSLISGALMSPTWQHAVSVAEE